MTRTGAFQPTPGAIDEPRARIRPIDMVHLAKQTLGDSGLQLEVLMMFEELLGIYFERLERSTTREELLLHLHTIKGAAAGIGARAVSSLAETAEHELRAGMAVDPERVEDLAMAVTECRAFIAGLLRAAEA